MNEPFSWPNSSVSISSLGTAAQFSEMKDSVRRGTFFVQRARDQFLAGAGFAANANARFAGGDVLHLRHHFLHGRAGPHDVMAAEAALEVAILFFEMLQAQCVFKGEQQLFARNGLF